MSDAPEKSVNPQGDLFGLDDAAPDTPKAKPNRRKSGASAQPPRAKVTQKNDEKTTHPPLGEEVSNERYLRDTAVAQRYDVGRQTVWRWVKLGKLPEPVKLTEGVTRWRLSDLVAYEASAARKKKAEGRRGRARKDNDAGERT